MSKENVIFFGVSDSYCFAVATVLLSLKVNSPSVYDKSDFLVYHDGITPENMQRLRGLFPDIQFEKYEPSVAFQKVAEHKVVKKWGHYVLMKLKGFDLIQKYKTALFLDADTFIAGDISELFNSSFGLAWRRVKAWEPQQIFSTLFPNYEKISAPNGGVIVFKDEIRSLNISENELIAAAEKVKDLRRGGMDERILAYVAASYRIKVRELEDAFNASPYLSMKEPPRIIHFYDANRVSKPWKNPTVYHQYKTWAQCYAKWLERGGVGPVDFQNKFYDSSTFFRYAQNSRDYARVLRRLDILKYKDVDCSFDFTNNYLSFFIKGIPHSLNFKLRIVSDRDYIAEFRQEEHADISHQELEKFSRNLTKQFSKFNFEAEDGHFFVKIYVKQRELNKAFNFLYNEVYRQRSCVSNLKVFFHRLICKMFPK